MSFFITGGDGQLGQDLKRILSKRGIPYFAPSHKILDITNAEQIERAIEDFLFFPYPQGVIHCAAFTDVDGCEKDRRKAYAVNTYGSRLMAIKAAEHRLPFVFISTDYVFDGSKEEPYKEGDVPSPINIYGQSKLKGEKEIFFFHPRAYIIRTSWLFGLYGHNFIHAVINRAKKGEPFQVVEDEVGLPTYTKNLAAMILQLLAKDAPPGIYHLANRGAVSRYELAKEALNLMGLSTPIEKIPSSMLHRPAERPSYSVLDLRKGEEYLEIRHFREGLEEYIGQLKKREESKKEEQV